MFSCEFCELSRKTFFTEHLWTTASISDCFFCISESYEIYSKTEFNYFMTETPIVSKPVHFSGLGRPSWKELKVKRMTRSYPAVFLTPFQKSIMKRFGKNRTIFGKKRSIMDIKQRSEYTSVVYA